MLTSSVTRAAAAMHITQPAASRLIHELERTLELRLFDRAGNRLVPTGDAVALFSEVERSFIGLERIAAAAHELRARRGGMLRIAAMPALANGVLPRFAGRFLAQRPDVDMVLFGLVSNTVLDWVVSDQCDVGFAAAPIQHAAARAELIPPVRYVAVVPEGHRLARRKSLRPQHFEGQPFIAIGPATPSRFRVDDVFSAHRVQREIRVETPLSEIACALVAAGVGVSVVDPFTASEYQRRGVVALPFEPAIEFQVAALFPQRRDPAPLAREFAAGFAEHVDAFRRERERP
jgi:DNA-binding transcriptional LysR family regulator